MKPSGLTLAFLVVFMMALMYNSVEAAPNPDADAEAMAEAFANAIATGDADAIAGWGGWLKKLGKVVMKVAPGVIEEVSS
ncbi:U-poneritoxin(01)-Om1a-like [Odontomachus brunneus]|uniref:U-poneritoxin(01)-Om1a-like n=1 Tax=Odontomachus brunneus TaxID=486640 RepID=UPI0013F1B108|nr:U-poneritoxin(01)-Om1a-like [Odontomachus brunneus]